MLITHSIATENINTGQQIHLSLSKSAHFFQTGNIIGNFHRCDLYRTNKIHWPGTYHVESKVRWHPRYILWNNLIPQILHCRDMNRYCCTSLYQSKLLLKKLGKESCKLSP